MPEHNGITYKQPQARKLQFIQGQEVEGKYRKKKVSKQFMETISLHFKSSLCLYNPFASGTHSISLQVAL